MSKRPVVVRVTQRFEQSAERILDAFLDPKLIGQWMFGKRLRDEEVLSIRLEPRVDGEFSYVVKRQNQEINHSGTFIELIRPTRLAFTWGVMDAPSAKSHVIVEIFPDTKGCDLTLTHELHPDWADFKTRTEAGWTKMLGVLAKVLSES